MGGDSTFMKCGNLQKVCEVTDTEGNTFRAEPYAIFISGKRRRSYHFYRLSEPAGFQSVEVRFISGVRMLDEKFTPRREYQPFDKTAFPLMHFSIPTHDGRQRWVDKISPADKSGLPYPVHFEG